MTGAPKSGIPRRELVTLMAYVEGGSHKAAAHHLAISESTCRKRVSQLMSRVGARSAAQAVWRLRRELEAEAGVLRVDVCTPSAQAFSGALPRSRAAG